MKTISLVFLFLRVREEEDDAEARRGLVPTPIILDNESLLDEGII